MRLPTAASRLAGGPHSCRHYRLCLLCFFLGALSRTVTVFFAATPPEVTVIFTLALIVFARLSRRRPLRLSFDLTLADCPAAILNEEPPSLTVFFLRFFLLAVAVLVGTVPVTPVATSQKAP